MLADGLGAPAGYTGMCSSGSWRLGSGGLWRAMEGSDGPQGCSKGLAAGGALRNLEQLAAGGTLENTEGLAAGGALGYSGGVEGPLTGAGAAEIKELSSSALDGSGLPVCHELVVVRVGEADA